MSEDVNGLGRPPRVFLSYCHESDKHQDRVLALADRLRRQGVDAQLDQYESPPPEGWDKWASRWHHEADFVLLLCTETFRRRAESTDPPGPRWLGPVVSRADHDAVEDERKFIAVVFTDSDLQHMPDFLQGASWFSLARKFGYEKLQCHLTGLSWTGSPPILNVTPMPARERRPYYREEPKLDKPACAPTSATRTSAEPPGMRFLRKNDQGLDEYLWLKDESIMIRIPAGEFTMGSTAHDGGDDERPQHQVCLSDYFIDKNEITNRQFDLFVRETGYQTDAEREGTGDTWNRWEGWVRRKGVTWRHHLKPQPDDDYFNGLPVVLVSWNDAQEYCKWAGKRLPTEAQWEKAARGADGRKYPWGDKDPTEDRANFGGTKNGTTPVGSYPPGVAPSGCTDMTGNVWEWCQDWYADDYYRKPGNADNPTGPATGAQRVLHGGSWTSEPKYLHCACRNHGGHSYRSTSFGFRCAFMPA